MPYTTIERLAVLETVIAAVQADVTDIKTDVKTLVQSQATLAAAFAVSEATARRGEQAKGSMGVWVRAMLPYIVSAAALVVAALHSAQ